MNALILNYQEEILELFKKHYRRLITKTSLVTFQEVLNAVLFEIDVKEINESESNYLKVWYELIHQHSFLDQLKLEDFQETILHSFNSVQSIDHHSKDILTKEYIEKADYQLALEVLALKNHQNWNYQNPFVSFNFTYKEVDFRLTLIHESCSPLRVSKVFFRKISSNHIDYFKNYSPTERELVHSLIENKSNILICGATASGKTTLIKGMLNLTSQSDHIIILEDTYELTHNKDNFTSLLSNKEGNNKSLTDYCQYALRMTPDRLIVGEMRSHEIVPFLLAMNTGHKGLMSTIHANSCYDAIYRAALLFSIYSNNKDLSFNLVMKLICKSVDHIIFMENKKIHQVIKLIGCENENPFYEVIYEI